MKYLFVLLTVFFLNACGDTGHDGKTGSPGDSITGPKGDAGTSSSGLDGSAGLNSLITLTNSDTLDKEVCKSEAGVVISSGLDLNSDGTLSDDEVTQTAVLCQTKAGSNNGNGPKDI